MFTPFDIKCSAATMFRCFDFECSAAAPFQRTLPLGNVVPCMLQVTPAFTTVVQVTPADRQLSVIDTRQLATTPTMQWNTLLESRTLNIWVDKIQIIFSKDIWRCWHAPLNSNCCNCFFVCSLLLIVRSIATFIHCQGALIPWYISTYL